MRSRWDGGRRQRSPHLLLACSLFWIVGAARAAGDGDWFACEAIAGNDVRLECYDRVTRERRDDGDRAAAPGERPRANGPFTSQEDFAEIRTRVSAVSTSARGRRQVVLDTGQVWAENEANRHRIAVGDEVVIRRALMRYSMELASGILVSVHRVK